MSQGADNKFQAMNKPARVRGAKLACLLGEKAATLKAGDMQCLLIRNTGAKFRSSEESSSRKRFEGAIRQDAIDALSFENAGWN
jgi:hypothetical protein